MTTETIRARPRRYGWRKAIRDRRDYMVVPPPRPVALPDEIDLRKDAPPRSDQGQLGSCVWHATPAVFEWHAHRAKHAVKLSALFGYLQTRKAENSVDDDAGCEIPDAMKVLRKVGVCHNALWPYEIERFRDEPPAGAYRDAPKHTIAESVRVVPTADNLRQALIERGPLVFGISAYESIESDAVARSGVVPMPGAGGAKDPLLGGHALALFGADHPRRRFLFRNSWGRWGLKGTGYAWIPYDYLTDAELAGDFFAIKLAAAPNDKPS
jgi:C1A family cysteine protease